jgi:hypothetical protein
MPRELRLMAASLSRLWTASLHRTLKAIQITGLIVLLEFNHCILVAIATDQRSNLKRETKPL